MSGGRRDVLLAPSETWPGRSLGAPYGAALSTDALHAWCWVTRWRLRAGASPPLADTSAPPDPRKGAAVSSAPMRAARCAWRDGRGIAQESREPFRPPRAVRPGIRRRRRRRRAQRDVVR